MIVLLRKFLILGPKQEMDKFFSLAQRAGFMEFIGLSKKSALEMPENAKTLLSAIKIVRTHIPASSDAYQATLDPVRLASHIVKTSQTRESLLEELRLLQAEISRIAPFGDFSRQEIDQLERDGKRVFQFFCMKNELAFHTTHPPEVIYVGTEYDLSYFLAINKESTQYPKMIEITIDRPVGELRSREHLIRLDLAKLEEEIRDAARALPYLQEGLCDYLNEYHLQLAKHDVVLPMGDSLFAIEAWVPETKIKAMMGLLSGLEVHVEEIAVEAHEKMPTYQENRGASKMGEDLVHVYDTPASTDKDPSLWVLIFFSLFFAMIVSDAGYGLVYLSVGLLLKMKFPKATGFFKRFIKLTILASSVCIVWGILTASFFGIEIGPNNPFRKASLLHSLASVKAEYHLEHKDDVYKEYLHQFPAVETATDGHDFLVKAAGVVEGKTKYIALGDFYDNILLEFSLFVGMIHISLSFLRNMTRNWTGLGWILFMVGGYLYFPSFLDATSLLNFLGVISKPVATVVGKNLLFGGLGVVFLISLLQGRKWGALHELTNAIQVFADVLSYLRLYALALAGMIMAQTFNDLGDRAGIFFGVFIILIGHIVNLNLTIMSGVIHGLRLNFLEWYHYSWEGGGRLFDPLRIKKVK
jgi:V/A-type H+-transporting ATPase subunit I